MAENLVPVYVNDARVRLEGDPKPQVSKIVKIAGKKPEGVQVFRLENQQDRMGRPLRLEDIIDRTVEENPVYLRLFDQEKGQGQPQTGTAPAGGARTPDMPPGERHGTPTPSPGSTPTSGGPTPPGEPEKRGARRQI